MRQPRHGNVKLQDEQPGMEKEAGLEPETCSVQ